MLAGARFSFFGQHFETGGVTQHELPSPSSDFSQARLDMHEIDAESNAIKGRA